MSKTEAIYEGLLWVGAALLLYFCGKHGLADTKTLSTLLGVLIGAVARQFGSTWSNAKQGAALTKEDIEALLRQPIPLDVTALREALREQG